MLRHFNNMHRSFLFVFGIICGASFTSGFSAAMATGLTTGQFLARDHLVIDLRSGVEWMRCSVGQQWNGTNCDGKIIRLNHDDVAKAIVIANEQLGGHWRLPTRKELEGLVCVAARPSK